MSDRMVVMQGGKVVEMGEADDIYNNPTTEYTQKLINAIPKGELEDIKKRVEGKENLSIWFIAFSMKLPVNNERKGG